MTIIFEDNDVLILHKPAGVVVNRAQSVTEQTVQDWFEAEYADVISSAVDAQLQRPWLGLLPEHFDPQYGEPEEQFSQRSGMVHRIDKETSGILVWAKNPGAMLNLMDQFKHRCVAKSYQCLVHGRIAVDDDTIRLPIARSPLDRSKFSVVPDGRSAETRYQVEQRFQGLTEQALQQFGLTQKNVRLYQGFSLVRCHPKTGRTHQIRVHFSYMQHPLVSDPLYLGKKRQKQDRQWCPRQFLHASQISFKHPRDGEELTFTAPLPEDLNLVLSYLN